MKSIIKDTLILTIITIAAGFFLGIVYEVTKEPISQQQEKQKQEAYYHVFKDAESFADSSVEIQKVQQHLLEADFGSQIIDEIVIAKDSAGISLGYVLLITSTQGYGGDITFTMGVSLDGMINGISILSINETAGLGMKANTPEFKKQFENKNVEKFVVTKSGVSQDNEIDAISGATITTNAVTDGVNAGLLAVQYIKGGS